MKKYMATLIALNFSYGVVALAETSQQEEGTDTSLEESAEDASQGEPSTAKTQAASEEVEEAQAEAATAPAGKSTADASSKTLLPEPGTVALPHLKLPWTEPSGVGMSIGMDTGAWGRIWRGGLKIRIPFGRGELARHWGLSLRGIGLYFGDADDTSDPDDGKFYMAGRLELFSQSDVLLNVIRIYGAGGVQYVHNVSGGKSVGFGGGGYMGFEFFCWRAISFYLEIGGSSGLMGVDDTYVIMVAGINIYPFSI